MIKVEKGVELPSARCSAKKYPWEEMKVGDSFFAPGLTTSKLSNAASWRRTKGEKFAVRETTEHGVDGARIWRIA